MIEELFRSARAFTVDVDALQGDIRDAAVVSNQAAASCAREVGQVEAAEAELQRLVQRSRELHARAGSTAAGEQQSRKAAVESLIDDESALAAASAEYRELRHRRELLTEAVEAVAWRVRNARRGVLAAKLDCEIAGANALESLIHLRTAQKAAAAAALLDLEGEVRIEGGLTAALEVELAHARRRAVELVDELDRFDAETRKLQAK